MGEVKQEQKWRHGDVYGIQSDVDLSNLTANGKKLDNGILAYGEVTGHMHEILADPACYSRYELDGKKFLVVLANAGVEITHQEHGAGRFRREFGKSVSTASSTTSPTSSVRSTTKRPHPPSAL